MTTIVPALAEQVGNSFQKLSSAASQLNIVSNELGNLIAELDAAFKDLNIGVSAWVTFSKWQDDYGNYGFEEIGYEKIGSAWGIGVRTRTGSPNDDNPENIESWLFNDAPRAKRLAAIEKLPELIEKLSEAAAAMTNKIQSRILIAQQVTSAVRTTADATKNAARNRVLGKGLQK